MNHDPYRPGHALSSISSWPELTASLRTPRGQARTRVIDAEALREVDPQLFSLRNCNSPAAYRAALFVAGIGHGAKIYSGLIRHEFFRPVA
jgi:hypothetical protein